MIIQKWLENPTTTSKFYRLPAPENASEVFADLRKKLKKIDITKFSNQINLSGINLSEEEIKIKVSKILKNLERIESTFKKSIDEDSLKHNKYRPIENILNTFNNTLSEIDPNVYLVKNTSKNSLERCKIFLNNCQVYDFTNDELNKLLEGELKIDGTNYQYIGSDLNLKVLENEPNNIQEANLNSSILFYEDGIELIVDKNKNVIEINQTIHGSKAYFINGNLNDIKIVFNGFNIFQNKNDLVSFPKNFPINNKGLTRCLSFINLNLKKIDIELKTPHAKMV